MIRSNRVRRATLKARALTVIRRVHRAALTATKALAYRARSGAVIVAVEAGHLVRTGDILDRLGASDLKDGYQSWYGRHVKKAHIAATGSEPVRVWVRHRTTGKWIHVHAYSPFDMALYIGLATYKQTKHLAQPAHFQAAYTAAA
ncbi:hypothetical protein TPA0906_66610 [Streptomyces olivaceus]|uniref:hypothetical protein n=1 Tax=Streptomyces olivaceus TaxID=47716 RepID=UPI0022EFC385|nr:hypothetical protein [Streptomyces olivaceus]GHJ04796.1 hypothetical protein TPA0906_66610 [Streptomyces olivaceus]